MLRTFLHVVVAASLAALATGCASPASVSGMTALDSPSVPVPATLEETVQIGTVLGGESTNPMWTSEVGNADYKSALENSLRAAHLLSNGEQPQYVVDATLISIDQPLLGFNLTVSSTISYVVHDSDSEEVVFDDVVLASYTASMGDAFMAIERLRLANEGSVRRNIGMFIDRIIPALARKQG